VSLVVLFAVKVRPERDLNQTKTVCLVSLGSCDFQGSNTSVNRFTDSRRGEHTLRGARWFVRRKKRPERDLNLGRSKAAP